MKVAHFNTFDSGGGAAKTTMRLHRALLQTGCDSTLFVAFRATDVPRVVEVKPPGTRLCRTINAGLLRWSSPQTFFSPDLLGASIASIAEHVRDIEIIHLHWLANFMSSGQIRHLYHRTRVPIVWTLLDMAPLTGGCHYAWDCQGYVASCGSCPQLRSSFKYDLSHWAWLEKRKNLENLPITIVAGTGWIVDRVRKSSLFRNSPVARIAATIDDQVFHPIDSRLARERWGLPSDAKIVFFGASLLSDERKGIRYLLDALNALKDRVAVSAPDLKILLLIAGELATGKHLELPFPARLLGYLNDDRTLAMAYQSADVFVCPSIEDAGPMMIPESMMCGTPVVAFDSGGAPDWIETMQNGYLAKYKDSSDMANGIYAMLSNSNGVAIRAAAWAKAMRMHAPSVVAAQYRDLYRLLTQQ